jgi:hypothetical protein
LYELRSTIIRLECKLSGLVGIYACGNLKSLQKKAVRQATHSTIQIRHRMIW